MALDWTGPERLPRPSVLGLTLISRLVAVNVLSDAYPVQALAW